MIAASHEGGGILEIVVVTEAPVLAAALVGFLVGFVWNLRRASRVGR
jgi:type III secretory pathway component EscS